tara:strand:- start:1635 stop:2396 length:762 start_codon:yes stop_codon:yes gene_type:complete
MAIVPPVTNSSGAVLTITDIEGDTTGEINFGAMIVNPTVSDSVTRVFPSAPNWGIIGLPFFLNSLVYGHNSKPGFSASDVVASDGNYDAFEFIKNHLYEFENDAVPIHYKYINDHANGGLVNRLIIFKDYQGSALLPEFAFNGVGDLVQQEGYQYKVIGNYYWKFTGTPLHDVANNAPEVNITFYQNGWYIFGFPYLNQIDAEFFLEEAIQQNLIILCKDFNGNALLPQYGFNGIGDFKPGQGYQIKLQNIDG